MGPPCPPPWIRPWYESACQETPGDVEPARNPLLPLCIPVLLLLLLPSLLLSKSAPGPPNGQYIKISGFKPRQKILCAMFLISLWNYHLFLTAVKFIDYSTHAVLSCYILNLFKLDSFCVVYESLKTSLHFRNHFCYSTLVKLQTAQMKFWNRKFWRLKCNTKRPKQSSKNCCYSQECTYVLGVLHQRSHPFSPLGGLFTYI